MPACSRKRLDASTGQQRQEQEILEIAVRPGWKSGTKITFQEKGEWLRVALYLSGSLPEWLSTCSRWLRALPLLLPLLHIVLLGIGHLPREG